MKKKKELKILAHPHFQKQMGIKPSEGCRPLKECIEEAKEREDKWFIKYCYYPFHWYFLNPIENIYWGIRYFFQRLINGFDDREVFNLDFYLKKWLAPRLAKLIETKGCGCPMDLTEKKWNKILNEILWLAKESIIEESKITFGTSKTKGDNLTKFFEREKKATKLLGKYLNNLWD